MGLLILKTKWEKNTNECSVEYVTPLEKCKDNYYNLKLDSVWAEASETRPVVVPVNYHIMDSGYIASIDSDEIVDSKPIKEYAQHITALLNGDFRNINGIHKRSSQKFFDILRNNHHTLPQAVFDANARDNEETSRYFRLKLPAKTYIFSNNIYSLYALGYSENQILYIENLEQYSNNSIPKELIDLQNRFAYSSVKSIYLAPIEQETVTNRMPVFTSPCNLKWLDDDTFESVYYPARRHLRFSEIHSPIPTNVRTVRTVSQPLFSKGELKREIKFDDTPDAKRRKLTLLRDWDNFAKNTQVTVRGRHPFDLQKLVPTSEETVDDVRYDYWRAALITHIAKTPVASVVIPNQYLEFSRKLELIKPLKQLMQDPKDYIKIAASAALKSYNELLKTKLEEAISASTRDAIKERLQRNLTSITEQARKDATNHETLVADVKLRRDNVEKEINEESENNINTSGGVSDVDSDQVSGSSSVLNNESIKPISQDPASVSEENATELPQTETGPSQEPSLLQPPVSLPDPSTLTENDLRGLVKVVEVGKNLIYKRKNQLTLQFIDFKSKLEESSEIKKESKEIFNQFLDKIKIKTVEANAEAVTLTENIKSKKENLQAKQSVIGIYKVNEKITSLFARTSESCTAVAQTLQNFIDNENTPAALNSRLLASKVQVDTYNNDIDNYGSDISATFGSIDEIDEEIKEDIKYLEDMIKAMNEINAAIDAGNQHYTQYEKIDTSSEEIDGLQIESSDIDDKIEELQSMSFALSNINDRAQEMVTQVDVSINKIKSNLAKSKEVYNNFLRRAGYASTAEYNEFVRQIEAEAGKGAKTIEAIEKNIEEINKELLLQKQATADAYVENLINVSKSGEISFDIEQELQTNIHRAQEYLQNIQQFTSNLQNNKSTLMTAKKQRAENYERQINELVLSLLSLTSQIERGEAVKLPEFLNPEVEIKNFEEVPSNASGNEVQGEGQNGGTNNEGSGGPAQPDEREDVVAGGTAGGDGGEDNEVLGGADPRGDEVAGGTAGGDGDAARGDGGEDNEVLGGTGPRGDVVAGGAAEGDGDAARGDADRGRDSVSEEEEEGNEIEQEYDERTEPDFNTRKKYVIGFIHFPNNPLPIKSYISVADDTSADDIINFFNETLDRPLLTTRSLNMSLKPTFSRNQLPNLTFDENTYIIENSPALPSYNTSYLKINLNQPRFTKLMRLTSISNNFYSVIIFANKNMKLVSDNFESINPFKNDFDNTLPLILTPINAGLFNTYATGMGETSCLGLIEERGRVKNAIPITMRAADKEHFNIQFYTTSLEEKNALHDTILYFHFIIEPF